MSRILLGVSGGIAAYKALEFVRLATGAGHAVRVVQTPTSRRFVGRASFAALSGAPVLVSEFEHDPARGAFPGRSGGTPSCGEHPPFGQQLPAHQPISHLELVRNADLYLIAPASANTLAKLACGLADNLLSSAALAATCPVVVAPAMNNHMYEHPAVCANLDTLRARGVHVIEPDSGRLASKGEEGIGRLPDPALLLERCEALLAGTWRGLHVLVTAGGTREPIDSVRFIGNGSSGRMGLALAEAARARGAEVTVVAANVALARPAGVAWREVATAAELAEACAREFPACDVLLMAAAVADFRPTLPGAPPRQPGVLPAQPETLSAQPGVLPAQPETLSAQPGVLPAQPETLSAQPGVLPAQPETLSAQPGVPPAQPVVGKLKKAGREHLRLELEATPDVLKGLAAGRRPGQTLVGFAAEHGSGAIEYGRGKLRDKGLDAVVVNDISRADIGIGADNNEVTILTALGEQHVPRAAKTEVAEAILDAVERLRAEPPDPSR